MTSHPNVMYAEWSAEMPNDLLAEYHNSQVQGTMQPFWQWVGCDPFSLVEVSAEKAV